MRVKRVRLALVVLDAHMRSIPRGKFLCALAARCGLFVAYGVPMPPRPHWKGYLKLSLVSCPIALYPAVSPAERISFRQVNKRTGNRVRQQLVDAVTGEPVASED